MVDIRGHRTTAGSNGDRSNSTVPNAQPKCKVLRALVSVQEARSMGCLKVYLRVVDWDVDSEKKDWTKDSIVRRGMH